MSITPSHRVLCMEDERGFALRIKSRLERAGYGVDLAGDGREGLSLLREREYDAVALDFQMPEVNGLQVLEVLLAEAPDVPAVMLTGNGDEQVAVRAMKLGAADYLLKDAEGECIRRLPRVLERVIEHRRLVREKEVAEQALRDRQARYRDLFMGHRAVQLIVNAKNGAVVDANPAAIRFYDADPDTIRSMTVFDVAEERPEVIWSALERARTGGQGHFVTRHRLPSGERRDVEIYTGPAEIEGRELLCATVHDITSRRRAQERLRESERRFRVIADHTYDWESWIGPGGDLRWVNPAVRRYTGYTVNACLAMKDYPLNLVLPEDRESVTRALTSEFGNDVCFRVVRSDGRVFWAAMTWQRVKDRDGGDLGIRTSIRDVTERQKAEEQVRYLASHDPVTGLANRVLGMDRLNAALSRARREQTEAAVVFLDLDGFKSVNDRYGHDAGDLLLRQTAWRLTSSVRETDSVVRLGGDEFVVILSDVTSSADVSRVLDRTQEALSRPYRLVGQEIAVTASMGVALYPVHGRTSEVLIKLADEAMYVAKNHGGDGIRYARRSRTGYAA